MNNKPDGGPFHPCMTGERRIAEHEKEFDFLSGASLRDFFAIHAPMNVIVGCLFNPGGFDVEHLADAAYKYADAMIEARSK